MLLFGSMESVDQLYCLYNEIKPQIVKRLKEFEDILINGSDQDIFKELVFCILTPQSKAKLCWQVVEQLERNSLLTAGDLSAIAQVLSPVRFRFNKARYIVELQKNFVIDGQIKIRDIVYQFGSDNFGFREWLVKNVKGLGYKEASHFLRNIGLGEDLAILDRHILKGLQALNIIYEVPAALSRKRYLCIERKMLKFASKSGIDMRHIDFLLWYRQTGYIFK